ncbi:MAG TPA: hypothetical protein VF733_03330 [Candidatus Saccharimonadales bacterium]
MSEHHIEAGAITPAAAVEQYLSVHPSVEAIDYTTLKNWCEVMRNARTPKEHYHAAWMRFELATCLSPDEPNGIDQERFLNDVSQVDKHFSNALSPLDPSVRARATVGKAALPLQFQATLFGATPDISSMIDQFEGHLMKVASKEVTSRRERDTNDINFLHSLAAMMIINSQTNYSLLLSKYKNTVRVNDGRRFVALPAPSRFAEPLAESDAGWNLRLWDLQDDDGTFRLRVGSHVAEHYYTLPLELLGHQGYPAKHDFGTLQALVDRGSSNKITSSNYVTGIRNTILERISADIDQSNQKRDIPKNLLQWYNSQPAEYHPYSVFSAYVDSALKKAELHFMASGLRPDEVMSYGWLQAEVGVAKVGTVDPQVVAAHFDQAHAAFNRITGNNWTQETGRPNGLLRYNALIAKEAITLQRAIALGDENLPDKVAKYTQGLCALTSRLEKTYEALRTQLIQEIGEEAADEELYRLAHQLTLCILASDDDHGRYVATPAPPRQRRRDGHYGWDVTILRKEFNAPNFNFSRQGRIYLLPSEEDEHIDKKALLETRNIFALPEDELDVHLLVLAKKKALFPDEITPEERVKLNKLFGRLAEATRNVGMF